MANRRLLGEVAIGNWGIGTAFKVTTGDRSEHHVSVVDPKTEQVVVRFADGKTATGFMGRIKRGECLTCQPAGEDTQPIKSAARVRTIRRIKPV